MKAIKLIIMGIISISLIGVGFFTILTMSDDKDVSASSGPDSTESSSEIIEATPEPTPTPLPETVKTPLGEITVGDLNGYSTEAVTWGPGVQFNDENQPTACVNLQEKYGVLGGIFLDNASKGENNKIYLTFDLGYESGFTEDILAVLKEKNAKATFFLTGSYAKNQEEIVKQLIADGHTVGSHSYSHPNMTAVSESEAVQEITEVYDLVKEKYGYETYLFRFPEGAFSEKTLALAAKNGHHSVFWSFAYNDWDNANQPDPEEALQKVTDRLHPGAVYLLHPMETNSKILGEFIDNARDAGYDIAVF